VDVVLGDALAWNQLIHETVDLLTVQPGVDLSRMRLSLHDQELRDAAEQTVDDIE